MKMEVLSVQQQFQGQFGVIGSTKVKDWTSPLTPPPPPSTNNRSSQQRGGSNQQQQQQQQQHNSSNNSNNTQSGDVQHHHHYYRNHHNHAHHHATAQHSHNHQHHQQHQQHHHPNHHHHHHHYQQQQQQLQASMEAAATAAVEGSASSRYAYNNNLLCCDIVSPHEEEEALSSSAAGRFGAAATNDDVDAAAVNELSQRLQAELRAAKSRHLACTEVSLPWDLTPRIAAEMIRTSEREPCGVRGCAIFIEFEDEPNNTRRIASFKVDPNTVSTFELYLTLKHDKSGWTSLLPQFLKNLTRSSTILISPDFTLTKNKLYSCE